MASANSAPCYWWARWSFIERIGSDRELAVFAELNAAVPKPRFTVCIYDDVTNLSLPLPENTCQTRRN
ncbi:hypothetical protein ACLK1T_28410 [Escherichia coli]